MRFKVDGLEEMLWWLLGWSGGVRVIKPEKLRLMLVEELQKALTLNSKTSKEKENVEGLLRPHAHHQMHRGGYWVAN